MTGGTRMFRVATAALVLVALAACTAPAPEAAAPDPGPQPQAQPAEPPPPPPDPYEVYADGRLSVMTLEQRIASLFIIHVAGTDPWLIRQYAAQGVAGVILMGDNIPDPPDALAGMTPVLSPESGLPILVGIDQEGGVVERIWTDEFASAEQLRGQAPEAAEGAFDGRGAMLDGLGVNLNFGIVADMTGDPGSFIFDRSFGGDPGSAADRVAAAVAGEHEHVLSTIKHFPGHGAAPGDSHTSIPATGMSYDEWLGSHAGLFAAGIDAGAQVVMFGHLRFDAVDPTPASLSKRWHEVLREELGFDGLVVTDDLGMLEQSGDPAYADRLSNAIRAIQAGNDLLLYVGVADVQGLVTGIADAVRAGVLDEAIVDAAAHRILMVRRELSGDTRPYSHCFEQCQTMLD